MARFRFDNEIREGWYWEEEEKRRRRLCRENIAIGAFVGEMQRLGKGERELERGDTVDLRRRRGGGGMDERGGERKK